MPPENEGDRGNPISDLRTFREALETMINEDRMDGTAKYYMDNHYRRTLTSLKDYENVVIPTTGKGYIPIKFGKTDLNISVTNGNLYIEIEEGDPDKNEINDLKLLLRLRRRHPELQMPNIIELVEDTGETPVPKRAA